MKNWFNGSRNWKKMPAHAKHWLKRLLKPYSFLRKEYASIKIGVNNGFGN
jgi:hypothetical protein